MTETENGIYLRVAIREYLGYYIIELYGFRG